MTSMAIAIKISLVLGGASIALWNKVKRLSARNKNVESEMKAKE